MPRLSPNSGEGAVSTGLMVVAHEAKSIAEARAVASVLEASDIPALVNLDLQGIVFPWVDPRNPGRAQVLVPSSMLPMSRDALAGRFHDSAWDSKDGEEDEDDGPIEADLPVGAPVSQRLLWALLAIAFGVALQRTMEHFLGSGHVIERFAARSPVRAEIWRLVTAGFLHASPEHLFANALFGLLLGVVLFGTHCIGATTLVWLLSSMVGLGTEASLSTSPLILGASAGNYGLVGLWVHGQIERARRSFNPRWQYLRTAGIILILLPGALTPVTPEHGRVAILAHIAGSGTGFLLGFLFHRRLDPADGMRTEQRSRYALLAALLIVVPTMICIGFLLTFQAPQ